MQEVQNTAVQYIQNTSTQTNTEQDTSNTNFQSYFSNQSSKKDDEDTATKKNLITTDHQSDQEKNIALASYTKTNTMIPVQEENGDQLLISEENQTLYESIVSDNYVSYDEIKNLSYEQIVEIKDFVMKKDENNEYIKRSFMAHDKKAGVLLGTTSISQDSNFNKSIFNIAKTIEDDKVFETFIFDIMGTQLSDQLMAYPEFQNIDYSKGASEYLRNKLASYQVKLDTASDQDTKEFYQKILNTFQVLTNQYKSLNGESIHDNTDSNAKTEALVKDLMSVIKTGFTESELEYMEQLLKEIRKLLKEKDDEDSTSTNADIEKQIKALEDALLALEKKVLGVVIVNAEDDNTQQNDKDEDTPKSNETNFEERMNNIEKKINVMKSGYYNQPTDFLEKDKEKLEEDKKKNEDSVN
jgi:hypothetical protein